MSSPTSSSAPKSSTSSVRGQTLSGLTISGGPQTFESFGSRTSSIKTRSVHSMKAASVEEASFSAATGNSASNSVHASASNIASDLIRIAPSGELIKVLRN